ncbi:MAG: alpha/beta hydrolase [Oscillospiraceae bacterium]|nr:alpha/beta hydrolase [Oscillospiraceae bacterium]
MTVLPIILGALAALTLILCAVCYKIVCYSGKKQRQDSAALPTGRQYDTQADLFERLIREMEAIDCEHVRIKSYDGTALAARYYHTADGAPLQIQFHGYRGGPLRDFCGGCKLALRLGHNVLLVEQRGHGDSGDHSITFGIRERHDCLAWANYAAERFGPSTKILLVGISMGGATVLMAGDLPLPKQVVGILADCPFSAPERIIRTVCRAIKLPDGLLWPFIRLGARIYGGFDLAGHSALQSIRRTTLPVQIIHGEEDLFVPCEMSRELAAAAGGPCTLDTFPGAGHGICYLVDAPRYEAIVQRFCTELGLETLPLG